MQRVKPKPDQSIPLIKARERIDKSDYVILKALVERLNIAKEIGRYKVRTGMNVTDSERERQIIADRTAYLLKLGINDPQLVQELYQVIFRASKKAQALTKS